MRLSIGFSDIATIATGTRGVSWIHRNNRDTCEPGFVFNMFSQLKKRPLSESLPIRFFNRNPEAFKFFNSYSSSGVFGDRDDSFTDYMIGVSLKSCFSAGDFLQASLCIFRTAFLQGAFKASGLFSNFFNSLAREYIPVTSSGNINYSHIHAENPFGIDRSALGKLNNEAEKEFAPTVNQVGLSSDFLAFELGVLANNNRHLLPTVNGENAAAIETLEGQKPLVINDSRILLEFMHGLFLNSVRLADFVYSPYYKLSRQIELFPNVIIAIAVKRNLTKSLVLMSYLRDVITSGIKNFHRLQKRLFLLFSGKKFNFYSKLHYGIYSIIYTAKYKGAQEGV